ncbi:MAG: Hsp70 family protein [Chromatiales bacterium]|nr:Hsp70 family protein [Chromatiales bacterium]
MLVEFAGQHVIRSAVFVDVEDKKLAFGEVAVDDYLNGIPGRLIMALKSVLGSDLMDENTYINGQWMPYRDVLGLLVKHIKDRADAALGEELDHVVVGRPVRFSDDDDMRDAKAESCLREVAHSVGFKHVEFQYEPVAAARTFELGVTRPQICCVVDLGGGTADFSVIEIGKGRRAHDPSAGVLANHGVHIGGTDLDYRLSLASVMPSLGLGSTLRGSSGTNEMPTHYFHELSRWHRIFDMYRPDIRQAVTELLGVTHEKGLVRRLLQVLERRLGHQFLERVERCKQVLSQEAQASIGLGELEDELTVMVRREQFIAAIDGEIGLLRDALHETFRLAGVTPANIDCACITGGTGLVPSVRAAITNALEPIELISQDPFTAVARGLTLDAMERFM